MSNRETGRILIGDGSRGEGLKLWKTFGVCLAQMGAVWRERKLPPVMNVSAHKRDVQCMEDVSFSCEEFGLCIFFAAG